MPRGDKSSYTGKQKRQAEHIEEGYERRGVSEREAERRAWATVNKETHGGKKSGSGRGKAKGPHERAVGSVAKQRPIGQLPSARGLPKKPQGPANAVQHRRVHLPACSSRRDQ